MVTVKLKINLTNRWLYSLTAITIFLALGIGVWAYNSGGPPSVMGHSSEEVEGTIKYLATPVLILDDTGAKGGALVSGDLSTILTVDISSLVPSYSKGAIFSLSSSFRSNDDIRARQQYFAWSQLPSIAGLDLKSPYLVLNNEAGKLAQSGGEADWDYTGSSNTFIIPLKNDKTFQMSRRQEQINQDLGFSFTLIGYT